MNLDTYQKFKRYLDLLEAQHDLVMTPNYDKRPQVRQAMDAVTANFEKQGIKRGTDEMTNFQVNVARAMNDIKTAHVFEIDTVMKRLLCRTQAPTQKNQIRKLHLPFPTFFLDVEITPEELPPDMKDNLTNTIVGMLITKNTSPLGDAIRVYSVSTTTDDQTGLTWTEFPITSTREYNYYDNELTPFLRNFIYNFLMFVTCRDIELATFHRSAANRASRIRAGKMPLPDSTRIIIKGAIKRYVTNNPLLFQERPHIVPRAHWVMGHLRHLRSGYYANKQGETIWIDAFRRGRGDLIKQTRSVIHTKREKDLISDTLYYGDIPILDKPLSQVREDNERARTQRRNKRSQIHQSQSASNQQPAAL